MKAANGGKVDPSSGDSVDLEAQNDLPVGHEGGEAAGWFAGWTVEEWQKVQDVAYAAVQLMVGAGGAAAIVAVTYNIQKADADVSAADARVAGNTPDMNEFMQQAANYALPAVYVGLYELAVGAFFKVVLDPIKVYFQACQRVRARAAEANQLNRIETMMRNMADELKRLQALVGNHSSQ
jgi:hypothetical protein